MKTLKFICSFIIALAIGLNIFAQTHDHSQMNMSSGKTETIKVWGNCDMCKVRIEKAAKIEGVSKADWNKETKVLTLIYNPSKVKSEDIQKKIAAVGHDTEKFKADDKKYEALDACCHYERKK
jgi:cation transport ATPase